LTCFFSPAPIRVFYGLAAAGEIGFLNLFFFNFPVFKLGVDRVPLRFYFLVLLFFWIRGFWAGVFASPQLKKMFFLKAFPSGVVAVFLCWKYSYPGLGLILGSSFFGCPPQPPTLEAPKRFSSGNPAFFGGGGTREKHRFGFR